MGGNGDAPESGTSTGGSGMLGLIGGGSVTALR
jgi:hypothetical protein